MARSGPAGDAGGNCPICTAPSSSEYRPFCSRRCADVDLSRWLRGAYAIPGETGDAASKDAEDAAARDDADTAADSPPKGPARRR